MQSVGLRVRVRLATVVVCVWSQCRRCFCVMHCEQCDLVGLRYDATSANDTDRQTDRRTRIQSVTGWLLCRRWVSLPPPLLLLLLLLLLYSVSRQPLLLTSPLPHCPARPSSPTALLVCVHCWRLIWRSVSRICSDAACAAVRQWVRHHM